MYHGVHSISNAVSPEIYVNEIYTSTLIGITFLFGSTPYYLKQNVFSLSPCALKIYTKTEDTPYPRFMTAYSLRAKSNNASFCCRHLLKAILYVVLKLITP